MKLNLTWKSRGFNAALLGLLCSTIPVLASAKVIPPTPAVNPDLAKHQSKFTNPRIEKVSEHIYFAIGYDAANMVFVDGQDCAIALDALSSDETAGRALADFRKISDKPIATVVYSHLHGDHVGGIDALQPPGGKYQELIGNERSIHQFEDVISARSPGITRRALAQLGMLLPKGIEGVVGTGIGAIYDIGTGSSFRMPNKTFRDRLEVERCGVKMELVYAPSDIEDGFFVWFPEEKTIYAGDTMHGVMPAINTPRYEKGREPMNFVRSIDMMMEYPVEHMMPGHGPKVSGRERVQELFQVNRDFTQYVHDQTVRYFNMGMTPDEVVEKLKVPERLLNDPDMGEHYHRLSWMIRGIYMLQGGWFSGDSVDFVKPLGSAEARNIIALAGGKKKLLKQAEAAYKRGDYGWAAQLATYLIRVDANDRIAKQLKAHAFRSIAYKSHSANERNYLLTDALVLEGKIDMGQFNNSFLAPAWLKEADIAQVFSILGPKLQAEAAIDRKISVDWYIKDIDQHHAMIVRNGVSQYKGAKLDGADVRVELNRETLINVLVHSVSWDEALRDGSIKASSRKKFKDFLSLYDL